MSFRQVAGTTDLKLGLNPLLLESNKFSKSVKQSQGKRTRAEYLADTKRFSNKFKKISGNPAFKAAYDEWREEPKVLATLGKTNTYHCHWGGGNSETPITPGELLGYIKDDGWPKDEAVVDAYGDECNIKGYSPLEPKGNFDTASKYQHVAIGRLPKNVDKARCRSVAQWEIMEQGLLNIIAALGKGKAESAEHMFAHLQSKLTHPKIESGYIKGK